jgi:preprotein translocase subunit YajC
MQTRRAAARQANQQYERRERTIAGDAFGFKVRSPILNMFQTFLAQAQSAAPQQMPGGGIGSFFVPLIFIFVIMYFVMIRPQKKRQEQQQNLIAGLKTGDRVVTNAGIHGLISNVKENTVLVKVADNVKIEMEKSAVTTVLKSVES